MIDRSNGWDAIADRFMASRSDIGSDVVRRWAEQLPHRAVVVDVGCGSGVPVSWTLIEAGFQLYGIDASPRLVTAFRSRFPDHPVACEAAERSDFFARTFDGAVAVGLLFLLPAPVQEKVLVRMAGAVKPGGRMLFSAPAEPCHWIDILTGQPSISLGANHYVRLLSVAGQTFQTSYRDEGGNHYLSFLATGQPLTA